MAFLEENDPHTKNDWFHWASELAKRGLVPRGGIEVHGPHSPPGNFIWGTCEAHDGRFGYEVDFRTTQDGRTVLTDRATGHRFKKLRKSERLPYELELRRRYVGEDEVEQLL